MNCPGDAGDQNGTGRKDAIDTLIFDEIDTGISGRTAWKVAEQLSILAGSPSGHLYHSSASDRSHGGCAFHY